MKKYLIVGHNYRRTSAGVRALHFLAHSINEIGGQAWVAAGVTNPAWNTPKPTDDLVEEIAAEGVVVYPAVDEGNAFEARRIARVVMNVPGYIRGSGDLQPCGACFFYVPMLLPYVPEGSHLLTIPVIDVDMFKPGGRVFERSGAAFWRGKGQTLDGIPDVWDHTNMLEITEHWPKDPAVIGGIFQTKRLFYSYTDYTALVSEARLCGCPAVVIPSGRFSFGSFSQCPGGMAGLAWGPTLAEIEKAIASVRVFRDRYMRDLEKWPGQLQRFLEVTQGMEVTHGT